MQLALQHRLHRVRYALQLCCFGLQILPCGVIGHQQHETLVTGIQRTRNEGVNTQGERLPAARVSAVRQAEHVDHTPRPPGKQRGGGKFRQCLAQPCLHRREPLLTRRIGGDKGDQPGGALTLMALPDLAIGTAHRPHDLAHRGLQGCLERAGVGQQSGDVTDQADLVSLALEHQPVAPQAELIEHQRRQILQHLGLARAKIRPQLAVHHTERADNLAARNHQGGRRVEPQTAITGNESRILITRISMNIAHNCHVCVFDCLVTQPRRSRCLRNWYPV